MSILRSIRIAALLGLSVALAACSSGGDSADGAASPTGSTSPATTLTVETNNGPVEVPANPKRVVALDNTSFQTLQALGVTPVALPKPLLPASLSAWADNPGIADIGTHREPKLEEINAAEPDLIVGGKRFAQYTEKLTEIAPVIDLAPSVEEPGYADALKAQTTTLAEIFGQPEVAKQLNAALDASIAEAAGLTHGQTVFLANHNGGKIDNGAGRMAPLIEPLNMTDVFAGRSGGSDSVHNDSGLAPETIAEANPDWMIVLDRDAITGGDGAASAKATIEAQKAWANTTFVTKNQILYLDAEFYVTEGIQAYTAFYGQLAKALRDAG